MIVLGLCAICFAFGIFFAVEWGRQPVKPKPEIKWGRDGAPEKDK